MGPLEETLSKSKIEPTGREIHRLKNSCSWAENRREMTYFILILWSKFCIAEKCKDLYWNQQKGSNSRNFIVLLEGESLQINCSGGFSFLFLQNFQVEYRLWFKWKSLKAIHSNQLVLKKDEFDSFIGNIQDIKISRSADPYQRTWTERPNEYWMTKVKRIGSSFSHQISSMSLTDSGKYVCLASDKCTQISREINVQGNTWFHSWTHYK